VETETYSVEGREVRREETDKQPSTDIQIMILQEIELRLVVLIVVIQLQGMARTIIHLPLQLRLANSPIAKSCILHTCESTFVWKILAQHVWIIGSMSGPAAPLRMVEILNKSVRKLLP
jgi:hypothetical protein